MKLKGRLKKAEFDAIKDDDMVVMVTSTGEKKVPRKDFYEVDPDNSEVYYLKEGETEDVTGLKSAFEKEKRDAKTRKEALDALKDVNPEKYRELMAKEEQFNTLSSEIEIKVAATNAEWEKKYNRDLKKANARSEGLYKTLEQTLIDNALLAAAGDKVLNPNMWLRGARDYVRIKEEKGDGDIPIFTAEVIDPKTKVGKITTKDGKATPMTIPELVDELGTSDEFKFIYKASTAHGSGLLPSNTPPANPGGEIRLTRQEAADPQRYKAAKEEAAKAGKTVRIDPIPDQPSA